MSEFIKVDNKLYQFFHYQSNTLGEDLPFGMYGPQITNTQNETELLMTYEKGIYSFQCRSSNDCYWEKKSYELKMSREYHVMVKVRASLVKNC